MLQHEENMGYHDNSIAAMLKRGETKGNAVIKKEVRDKITMTEW